jgi:hypothetical protein
MKNGKRFSFAAGIFCAVLLACGSPARVSAQFFTPPNELDAAIRETSNYLNKQLRKGNKLMILNVQSDYPALSEYIIDELTANTVNDRVFPVVDRQQLDAIRAELSFQMSGEVDDATAQSLGRMAGAQVIISGAVSRIGSLYRLRVRALSVQTAQIEGQFNRNIPDAPTIMALVNSKATGYGGGAGADSGAAQAPAKGTAAVTAAPVSYKTGDTGPAGGLVFYDKGNNSGGWRYLEAAPAGTEFKAQLGEYWGMGDVETRAELGNGKANTLAMRAELEQAGEITKAAHRCTQLNINGHADWFLPSKGELGWMYVNLKEKGLGDFSNDWYWSSTLETATSAPHGFAQNFRNGTQTESNKTENYSVRAIRQF